MKIPPQVYAFLIGSLVFYAAGEYFAILYSLSQTWKLFFFAMLMYIFKSALWLPAVAAGKSLTVISTIWNLSYMMMAPIIGLAMFKETITTCQGIGLGLGLAAMVLMNY